VIGSGVEPARAASAASAGSTLFRGRWEWLLLGVLVLAAFAIRVYDLGGLPDTVLADEADNTQSAVGILFHRPPATASSGLTGF
jgi:hypothetical protein